MTTPEQPSADDQAGFNSADSAAGGAGGDGSQGAQQPSPRSLKSKSAPSVFRTILDLEACRKVMEGLSHTKEQQIRDRMVRTAPGELGPASKAVDNYRDATPCDSIWENLVGSERVKFCDQCRLQVYDFTSISAEESDEIIFKREGKKGQTLFRRADGRFLTSDCPVGIARRSRRIVLMVAGIAMLIIVFAVLLLMPHPKPTVSQTKAPSKEAPKTETAPAQKQSTESQNSFVVPGSMPPRAGNLLPSIKSTQGATGETPLPGFVVPNSAGSPVAPPGVSASGSASSGAQATGDRQVPGSQAAATGQQPIAPASQNGSTSQSAPATQGQGGPAQTPQAQASPADAASQSQPAQSEQSPPEENKPAQTENPYVKTYK